MKLILDYSKWRCGMHGRYKLGKGPTQLLNKEGFMCCLGQFSKQVNTYVTDEELINQTNPFYVSKDLPGLTKDGEDHIHKIDTLLSYAAIEINDSAESSPQEKIVALKELFCNEGHEIEVINQPETV